MPFRSGTAVIDVTFTGGLVPTGAAMWYPALGAAPAGFLIAAGQAVDRVTYADLFALYGTLHGAGDGSTTFNLPDLRGRVPVMIDSGAGRLPLANTVGATGGASTHVLTAAQLAAHTHGVTDPGHTHAVTDPGHSHGPVGGQLYHSGAGPFAAARHSAQGNAGGGVVTIASSAAVTDAKTTGVTVQTAATGLTVDAAGSGAAHPNDQPWIAGVWIVKT